ncbi:hypothetical protein MtrunA17_Chr2g0326931 [Medicago truncatula]|uniref:Uncharacterized protein n=1 Tax=Medicago truncatula TaxID=3880 RepID=A0A396JCJ1_MEDTR|nr:hypothetical protein MtrunA17_Chr2g0326931 [Medicago truncatula]
MHQHHISVLLDPQYLFHLPISILFNAGFQVRQHLVIFEHLLPRMLMSHSGKDRHAISLIHKMGRQPDSAGSNMVATSSHQAAFPNLACYSDDE